MFEESRDFEVGRLADKVLFGYVHRVLGKYQDAVSERETFFAELNERTSSGKSYFAGGLSVEAVVSSKNPIFPKSLSLLVRSASHREGNAFFRDFVEYISDLAIQNRIKTSMQSKVDSPGIPIETNE